MIAIDFSRFLSKVSEKCLSIQKFNLGNVCLKVVVKIALSLQRLASARQMKIFNHTMIVPSQLIATEEEATQYAEQITEEEEEEDMFVSRFAGETDLPDWYFICFLGFRFFLLLSMRLFL